MTKIEEGIKQIKMRKTICAFLLCAILPLALIDDAFKGYGVDINQFLDLYFVWFILSIFYMAHVATTKCPRCHKLFFGPLGFWAITWAFTRTCNHCSLKLNNNSEENS